MPALQTHAATDRVTAAFARVTDARYAIGILERCGVEPVDIALDTVEDGRGGVQLVILRVDTADVARERVLAAISGGHGVPVADLAVEGRPARVA
jgi:hypothetical protein